MTPSGRSRIPQLSSAAPARATAKFTARRKTAIWDKAEDIDVQRYADSPYGPILERFQKAFIGQGRDGYPAERLGELIYTALSTPKPKVRYAAVKGRLLEKLMMRLASKRALDRMIGKMLGLRSVRKS